MDNMLNINNWFMVKEIISCYVYYMFNKNPLRDRDYLLGRRIQRIRQKKGITQERLAEELKISITHLAMVETGKSTPSLKLVYKIADTLDVKVEELFKF